MAHAEACRSGRGRGEQGHECVARAVNRPGQRGKGGGTAAHRALQMCVRGLGKEDEDDGAEGKQAGEEEEAGR